VVANIVPFMKHRLSAKHSGTYYFQTGFLTQLLALESNQWGQVISNIHSDLLEKDMLFFPVQLTNDVWSLFAVVALPYFGKKGVHVPILYYFYPNGTFENDEVIIEKGNRIRVLLNIMWRNKFNSKVDKIENPFNKRSLPLKCVKGESRMTTFICPLTLDFFKLRKNPETYIFH
jgi:hypothetical protein